VDPPCHAVVIEDLSRYRPEEMRTRRENRQLMSWSSSKVKKHLEESCKLNGLHLRPTYAGYTSRQDSRTGAPGLRCQDVPVKEFLRSPFWRRQVVQAEKASNGGDARGRLLLALNKKWKDAPDEEIKNSRALRIPLKGGELFVSAGTESSPKKALQADLNAAANIGLKPLLDPDWPGSWWRVPCHPGQFTPVKVKGSRAFVDAASPLINKPGASDKKDQPTKEAVNLWRNVSSPPISAQNGPWLNYTAYWNRVESKVIESLETLADLPKQPAAATGRKKPPRPSAKNS